MPKDFGPERVRKRAAVRTEIATAGCLSECTLGGGFEGCERSASRSGSKIRPPVSRVD
jgi:hypothetical protein